MTGCCTYRLDAVPIGGSSAVRFSWRSPSATGRGERRGRLSAAEAAAAVDDDALAGDEAGVFGGEEAHSVGDVAGGSHPPGGYRGEISIPDFVRDVGVALNGDEAGRDRVHGDAGRGEFAGPAAGQADLRALGGGIGGPAGGGPVGDLGVD